MTINFQLSSLICCIVAVLAMFSAAALPAQPVWPRGTARVSGVVLDSSTRRPIVRTKICREVDLSPPHGKGTVFTSPDSVGRYVLADLPEGQQAVSFVCTGDRKLGCYLRFDTLIVGAGEEGRAGQQPTVAEARLLLRVLCLHVLRGMGGYPSRAVDERFHRRRFLRDASRSDSHGPQADPVRLPLTLRLLPFVPSWRRRTLSPPRTQDGQ